MLKNSFLFKTLKIPIEEKENKNSKNYYYCLNVNVIQKISE